MFSLVCEELLSALNREQLLEQIKFHYNEMTQMPEPLHNLALEYYNKYLIIGGMPAVVNNYIETNSFLSIKDIQGKILNEYIADMSKYATPSTSVKIRSCYNSIPTQLAKENNKFQYKVVQKGGSSTIFGEAIDWLLSAGIVLKTQRLENAFIPIKAYQDFGDFKLYMNDVGMLTMHSDIPFQLLQSSLLQDNTFLGSVAENYVAQAFAINRIPLFYWK
ncbi:MAG: DUF4143 domain-containing protein, partial [Bacteroidales bacterium]|nr:DUF4143 domain-containing protein [Bacteroidales bacterium]